MDSSAFARTGRLRQLQPGRHRRRGKKLTRPPSLRHGNGMPPRSVVSLACLSLAVLSLQAAPPTTSIFIRETPPAPIYRDGWIDLNKNGVKDPYEDPALDVEARITDLLARMTLEEKTAQMVTLYGFPRVLKDELPVCNLQRHFARTVLFDQPTRTD